MTQEPEWHIIGQSVRGASHFRSGLPNQDAIAYEPESGVGPPLILAISDGHGSDKSFRSHLGSAFAVEYAVVLLHELVELLEQNPKALSAINRTAEEPLPRELVRRWQQAVDEHLAEHPFTEDELKGLARSRGEAAVREVQKQPRLAYGATLLAVLVTEAFLLFMQLGDGDILVVSEKGEVAYALQRDPRLMANETTSLCMKEAWREVRTRFQARYGELPALIVVSTDGYANSFVNEAAFLKVGSDLLRFLQTDGAATVQANLLSWLEEASSAGSGDDITLGMIYRDDVVCCQPVATKDEVETVCDAPLGSADGVGEASEMVLPDAQAPVDTPQATAFRRGIRSQGVERIKQVPPSEPAKQGPLPLSEESADGAEERLLQGHD